MGVPVPVICCLIAGIVIVLIFCGAFFVELFVPEKEVSARKESIAKEEEFDIDEMLAKLEKKTKVEEVEKEPEIATISPIIAPAALEELSKEEKIEEKEELKVEEDSFDCDALFKQLEEEAKNSVIEEKAEEEESEVEEKVAEVVEIAQTEQVEEAQGLANEVEEVTIVNVGPDFDYNVRIETIRTNQAKLEKDLAKATREVNKYEKTEKRKARNEKILDRKSAELTNLNLVLYSVNNLEDIDLEKKKKQEDLIEHITELKNGIESAKEYLENNKEKYSNSKKIKDFLTGEKARYEEELAELDALINAKKNK